jgi:hypothetical protein
MVTVGNGRDDEGSVFDTGAGGRGRPTLLGGTSTTLKENTSIVVLCSFQ